MVPELIAYAKVNLGIIIGEQNGENRWRNGEGHVVERLTPTVAMAHTFDGDGGRLGGRHGENVTAGKLRYPKEARRPGSSW